MSFIVKHKKMILNLIAALVAILMLVNPGLLEGMGFAKEKQTAVLTFVGFLVAILNIIFHQIELEDKTDVPTEEKK